MHPALAPLKPFYDGGQLGFVHAAGRADRGAQPLPGRVRARAGRAGNERDHRMDRPGPRGTRDGHRFPGRRAGLQHDPELAHRPGPEHRAGQRRRLLAGRLVGLPAGVRHGARRTCTPASRTRSTEQANLALDALSTAAAMQTAGYTPTAGVTYPTTDLGKALKDLAWLIKSNVGLQIACLDYDNWDMHAGLGQPGDTKGWLHGQLADVAACLAAFATDLGPALSNVTLVTLSEFGRRAYENGSGGADHGLGQAVLALGGGVNGGQVLGPWPTLAPGALADGDLAVTTDYRSILSEILTKRCGLASPATVFPNFTPAAVGIAK